MLERDTSRIASLGRLGSSSVSQLFLALDVLPVVRVVDLLLAPSFLSFNLRQRFVKVGILCSSLVPAKINNRFTCNSSSPESNDARNSKFIRRNRFVLVTLKSWLVITGVLEYWVVETLCLERGKKERRQLSVKDNAPK